MAGESEVASAMNENADTPEQDAPRSPPEAADTPLETPQLGSEPPPYDNYLDSEPTPKLENEGDDAPTQSETELPPSIELKAPTSPPSSPSPPPLPSVAATPEVSQHVVAHSAEVPPDYRTQSILSGHTRSISSVKFNPEGTLLASAGERVICI